MKHIYVLHLSVIVGCSAGASEPVPPSPAAATPAAVVGRAERPRPARPAAAPAPARTVDARSEAVLRQALESEDFTIRMIAVEAIGEARHLAYVEWLGHALGDPEPDVRLAAVESLRRLGSPRARELLLSVRDDELERLDVRAVAASAFLASP